ncbi:IclR family transcriptional regulator [Protofrankia symbiont of Coriaria ruscifolia]|uniref:IclR family transcriptional regulator n=1 Tax=Protofrankia symbiont of Coriaria ruscifolia TaxID=1306542 RepID=UPI0013EFBCBE|nr:IclR family transcriptional regulator [Protofrankia symbiont of Coriaria ruscifolia]
MSYCDTATTEATAIEAEPSKERKRENWTRSQQGSSARNLLEKAYFVLGALPADGAWIGLSEVARITGLPKSTVHRLLGTLTNLRLADRHGAGYRLGPRMMSLVKHASGGYASALRDFLLPHLLDLFQSTGHSVHLCVEHMHGALCLEHLHGHTGVRLRVKSGSVLPKHTTAIGRVLTAHSDFVADDDLTAELSGELKRIRREGIAIDVNGLCRGTTCVAAPIWSPARTVMAVFAVTGPVHGLDVPAVSHQLRRAAHSAARDLARSPHLTTRQR